MSLVFWLSVSMFAGGLTSGLLIAKLSNNKNKRKAYTCDCKHVYSSHKIDEPHPCAAAILNIDEKIIGYCPCQRYVGPVPIDNMLL